jgi:predicted PurR-regulated permease PerM
MPNRPLVMTVSKWFFLLVAVVVFLLFWQILKPFVLTLATAAIFAVMLSPLDRYAKRWVKWDKWRALILVLLTAFVVILPIFVIVTVVVAQASALVGDVDEALAWLAGFDLVSYPVFQALPVAAQEQILAINVAEMGTGVLNWIKDSFGGLVGRTANIVFQIFIFFIALYYFLVGRVAIYKEALRLSPLNDKTDANIVRRIVKTIRAVVSGALTIALIQAVIATVGLWIFGVPGAILWGSFIVIAAQVPMIGTMLVMGPAIAYLAITGHVGAAIGLAIWSIVFVGLIDNLLSPYIVGSKTKMPEILVLISILGGIQFLGPIGFILGPTILAGVLVVVDLYKSGILEN